MNTYTFKPSDTWTLCIRHGENLLEMYCQQAKVNWKAEHGKKFPLIKIITNNFCTSASRMDFPEMSQSANTICFHNYTDWIYMLQGYR
jgi:hypothetical protein